MTFPLIPIIKQWEPFKIDALGLVTIMGAERTNRILGQLTHNTFTAWLPMLAAHIIANNDINSPIPGFSLYNITDGIVATDLTAWFARWLLNEDLKFSSSTVSVSATSSMPKRIKSLGWDILSYALGLLNLVPLVFSIALGDWWGFTNAVAVVVSVLVRQMVLGQNRLAIDRAADSDKIARQPVKVLVILPDGRAVAVRVTRDVLLNCLLTDPRPTHPRLYTAARAVGWAAFGIHVVALGMASLVCQLVTILLLILPTIVSAWEIGTDRRRIGRRLCLVREDADLPFRAAAYARLGLSATEQESMLSWNLFPQKSNEAWWTKYNEAKATNKFDKWSEMLSQSPKSDSA